jgi:hypothetical protein
VSRIRKRSLRDLAAMALSGTGDVDDAGLVLGHSLAQLKLNVDALVSAIELGSMEKSDIQGHLIGLQYRCAALENFTDECLVVEYLPLDDEHGAEAAQ